jgi:hypothetical protein
LVTVSEVRTVGARHRRFLERCFLAVDFRFGVFCCALMVPLLSSQLGAQGTSPNSQLLDAGYREMYNLDFEGAHKSFQQYEQTHPQDPLGPVSNAAAYLFSEFDRLHILEVELFTDNQTFSSREKSSPDPAVYAAFDKELNTATTIADGVLARAFNRDAWFAKILANGLRGDYLALIEKRNLAGLNYMKAGRVLAEKLVSLDPSYYDAYLAIGVENYLLGVNVAPVRWFLRLGGAETNKDQGIVNLKLTASKGRYLAPYARLLLAVAALRDQDRATAKALLAGLSREFPQNALFQREFARIQP